MNSTNTTSSKTQKNAGLTPSSITKKIGDSKLPTIAGISLPEIAILGAAGFVLWKNREKVSTFLTDNGIDAPGFLSGDLSELIQAGVSMIGKQGQSSETTSTKSLSASRKHDA